MSDLPINVDLLSVSESDIKNMREITALQIFDNNNNFHPEGLFSTTIFGTVGSEYRNRMFGYINLKTNFIHPLIFLVITKLKALYGRIIAGKETAIWDSKTKSFIQSNEPEARTGFIFFMEHIEEIVFERNNSTKRDEYIDAFNSSIKNKTLLTKYLLVMPAGLRDYSIDSDGRPQEDEINAIYRKVMFQTNLMDKNILNVNPSSYDTVMASIQTILLDLYNFIISLIEGKHKLIMGKWLTRKIFNSTRNVLSSNVERISKYNDPNRVKYNETLVGLNQFLKCIMPKSIYEIKSTYIDKIFREGSQSLLLPSTKDLKSVEVHSIKLQKDAELWTSMEGLEKVIANYANLNIRYDYITVNSGNNYLCLIYVDDKYFKVVNRIEDAPEHIDRSKIRPINLSEMLYLSIYRLSGNITGFVARYPIIEHGSVYPCYLKVKTTMNDLSLEELDDDWKPSGYIASAFPSPGAHFYNTSSAHWSHWPKMGADTDGDTISVTAVLAEEGKQEIDDLLKSRKYYVSSSNKFNFTIETDAVEAALVYMTR